MSRPDAPRNKSRTLKVAGLFAGSGGLTLGLRKAHHKIKVLSEIDPHARAVLEDQFSEATLYDDVRQLRKRDLSGVDLLAAGFPCQDLSQVGPKKGIHGHRSGLIGEVVRLVKEVPIEWVVLENVSFLRILDKGAGMRWILRQLDRLGYRWAYRTIDSRAFGVPQRRKRIYVVASRSAEADPRSVLLWPDKAEPESPVPAEQRAYGFYWTEGNRGLGWVVDAIPTLKAGSAVGPPSPPAILRVSGEIIIPDIRDAERMQGFPQDWTKAAAKVGGRANGRWRLVGNAVTVNVAEWLGKRLATPPRPYAPRPERDVLFDRNNTGAPMPPAAWSNGDGQWYEARVDPWPARRCSSLEIFLRYEGVPLSAGATEGFLRRLTASRLSRPDGFERKLKEHIRKQRGGS